MGINELKDNFSALNLELFQEIFKRIEPEAQIDCFEETQASGRGDNYTATLHRIHLTGYRTCSIDGNKCKWEKNVICKRMPENIQRREAYKSDNLFRNEVQFYMRIMPELLKYQATKLNKTFCSIPKVYYARSDLLIMDDLCTRGFKMPDRKKGLTLEETETVLLEVARFHSLSLAFKFDNPIQFETLKNLTTEGLFSTANEDWYKNYYERLTKNAIDMISDVFPKDSKYLIAMKRFAESTSFFSKMVDLVHKESPLTALCHGDCWANNFLYRYETCDNGDVKVLEVCLVDFQLIRYSSIALDISNLLFCCTTKSLRDNYSEKLLKLYTTELFRGLNSLCSNLPEFCNTLEKLEKQFAIEIQSYGRFALGLALDIIPISTCSAEDAPDLYLNRNDDLIEAGAPTLNFPPNDLCRQKMSEILIDLVDGEML